MTGRKNRNARFIARLARLLRQGEVSRPRPYALLYFGVALAFALWWLAVPKWSRPFTLDALQRHYKALAKKHHPDANGGSVEAETKMKLINAAYRTLKAILNAGV